MGKDVIDWADCLPVVGRMLFLKPAQELSIKIIALADCSIFSSLFLAFQIWGRLDVDQTWEEILKAKCWGIRMAITAEL